MDSKKIVRVSAGVIALLASALMIISSNIMIADLIGSFGDSSRATSIVIMSYVIIITAVLSKLFSILLVAGVRSKGMAAAVIVTQLIIMAFEIATAVLWRGMPVAVTALDISFMIPSVIAIIVSIVYMVQGRSREANRQYN